MLTPAVLRSYWNSGSVGGRAGSVHPTLDASTSDPRVFHLRIKRVHPIRHKTHRMPL